MNQIHRMLLSAVAGLIVYFLYWWIVYRRHGVPVGFLKTVPAQSSLRSGMTGLVRTYGAWALALTVYAFGIEDSGSPFTRYWLQESIMKANWAGDWIGIAVVAGLLTAGESYRARVLLTEGASQRNDKRLVPRPATFLLAGVVLVALSTILVPSLSKVLDAGHKSTVPHAGSEPSLHSP